MRDKKIFLVIAVMIALCVAGVCLVTFKSGSRILPMEETNLSAMDPEKVTKWIADVGKIEDPASLVTTGDGLFALVTGDFDWNDGNVPLFYEKDGGMENAELRFSGEGNRYYVTKSYPAEAPERSYKLVSLLNALNDLPQEEIRRLLPSKDGYKIVLTEEGAPQEDGKTVTYCPDGVGSIDGWLIHLTVSTVGNDTKSLELFYGNAGVDPIGFYYCEAPGFGGDFTLSLREDGTFQYYEGSLSSYIGTGTWEFDGKTVTLSEGAAETVPGGTPADPRFVFTVDGGALIFEKEKSGRFLYVDLEDGVRFLRSEQPKEENLLLVGQEVYHEDIDFKAQVIRTNGYHEGESYPKTFWITSTGELKAYYEQNKDKYALGVWGEAEDPADGFTAAVSGYDEKFFEDNDLIMVVLEESSGSVRHEVTAVRLYPSILDRVPYFIEPEITEIHPEVGTCDMAQWHIIIEVSKKYGSAVSDLQSPRFRLID